MINTHGIHPGHTNFNFEKFPEFWGIACFSLEGIGLIFPIRGSLKTQTTFKPLFNMICAFFIVIYIIFGVLCTLGLGDTTQEIIFHNFPKSYTSIYLLQFLYAFGIFITFPVYVQTTVNIIKRIDWFDKLFSGQKEYRNSTIARMMAITFYFGISLSGVNLLDFMNLSGSICNCYLAFILPVIFFIKTKKIGACLYNVFRRSRFVIKKIKNNTLYNNGCRNHIKSCCYSLCTY